MRTKIKVIVRPHGECPRFCNRGRQEDWEESMENTEISGDGSRGAGQDHGKAGRRNRVSLGPPIQNVDGPDVDIGSHQDHEKAARCPGHWEYHRRLTARPDKKPGASDGIRPGGWA